MNPSQEAIQLAMRLSGHTSCERNGMPCEFCLGDAATIDDALQLPQRNAALLLAQAVCDADEHAGFTTPQMVSEPIDQLRDALAQIK